MFDRVILWGRAALLAALLTVGAGQARAEEYATPNLANLVKTLVRFGALDIRKDDVIDLFGRVTACSDYQQYYGNDFRWQEFRAALREDVRKNIAVYPTGYKYDAPLQLDRYDFKAGLFRFTEKTAQSRANVFTMDTHPEDLCGDAKNVYLPLSYKLVLDEPIQIAGLPLSVEEGKILLNRMIANNNPNRMIYARFYIRVLFISPIAAKSNKEADKRGESLRITQDIRDDSVRMDSKLDYIEYYEDPERTKLVYTYRP